MPDSAGWTDAQIFATVGGVFGLILLLIVVIAILVWRHNANRTAAMKAWAAERGLTFQEGAAGAPDLTQPLGEVKVRWQIRGSLNGQPITILDTTQWVGENVGSQGHGKIMNVGETFAFYDLVKPLPMFEAKTIGGTGSMGAAALAFARRIGRETGVKGQVAVGFDEAPGVQVFAVDPDQTRALLSGAPIAALSARTGWRMRTGGSALMVSWCPDLGSTEDATVEAKDMDSFVANAQALAATVRQSVAAS